MVANTLGRSLLLLVLVFSFNPKSSISWPSTTDMDELSNSLLNTDCFFARWFVLTVSSGVLTIFSEGSCKPEQECSTKIPGKKRTNAIKPVDALTHLEFEYGLERIFTKVNFKMSLWCFQISQKPTKFLPGFLP